MFLVWCLIASLGIVLDQVTKIAASAKLSQKGAVPFIPYVFNFTYVENRGAAWGMFADQRWVFMTVSTVAIVLLLCFLFYYSTAPKMFCICLAMILSGGVGNMIDRVRCGFVTDFIQFDFWKSFPVFNVADIFITVGCFLMVIYIAFIDKTIFQDKKEDAENNEDGNG